MRERKFGPLQEIEELRSLILEHLKYSNSNKSNLFELVDYFQRILQLQNKSIQEAYINEFLENFIQLLNNYNPFYITPLRTENILKLCDELKSSGIFSKYQDSFEDSIKKLNLKSAELNHILNNDCQNKIENKIYFPVLEQSDNDESVIYGLLESNCIQVQKTDGQTKFRLIPAEVTKDKQIEEQISIAWNLAVKKVKPFINKIDQHHEVFIHFDTASGYYRGNSLGTALVLLFIDKLLKFYNAPSLVITNGRIAFTGGLDNNGKVLNTSAEIIKQKTEIVFYSDAQIFCIPKDEEHIAEQAMDLLRQKYPKRELKLIGVESLEDILVRRTIVTIKKLNPIKRTGRFVLRNVVSTILILLLLFSVYAAGFWDFDDNPAYCEQSGKTIIVKNKNGKQLWTKNTRSPDDPFLPMIRVIHKVIDIDFDNKNEVIISFGLESPIKQNTEADLVYCFNSDGDLVWQYPFKDTIETVEGKFTNPYGVFILGSYEKNGRKIILLSAKNNFYPTAIFQLDAKTGDRVGTTLWHAGHVNAGIVGDFNNDGNEELVAAGINNCYESVTIFSINLDKLDGYAPAVGEYKFVNQKLADFNKYQLIEKTDLTNYFRYRFNFIFPGGITYNRNSGMIIMTVLEGNIPNVGAVSYIFDTDLNPSKIDPSDDLQMLRDSLVYNGLITGPYTKSREYRELLWKKVKTWDGNQFVQMSRLE